MREKQHSDNLEQFFKKNLENYSPEPSPGFWSGMEAAIPAKPPFWSGWITSVGKIIIGAAFIAGLAVAGNFWYNDHQKIKELSVLLAEQEKLLNENQNKKISVVEKAGLSDEKNVDKNLSEKSIINVLLGEEIDKMDEKINNQKIYPKNLSKKNNVGNINEIEVKSDKSKIKNNENFIGENKDRGELNRENKFSIIQNDENEITLDAAFDDPRNISEFKAMQKILQRLNVLSIQAQLTESNTLSLKTESNYLKGPAPYPRFSLEGGTSVFLMPMGHLFSDSSTVSPGNSRISFGGGFLVNFELNSSLLLQSGFLYKNVNTDSLTVNYNSFPFVVKKKLAWGYHKKLELKTGVELNTLINARTPESTTVENLNTSHVGWLAGVALAMPAGEKMELIIEPNFAYAITPVAEGKRTFSSGLNLGLRYALK